MVVIPAPRVTDVRFSQPLKADSPIVVTTSGIIMVFRSVPENAPAGISVRSVPVNVTDARELQPLNAPAPSVVKFWGSLTEVSPVFCGVR
jgi:hypothetical protein